MLNGHSPSQLTLLERFSVRLSRLNENSIFKAFQHWYCAKLMSKWFMLIWGRRTFLDNVDSVIHLNPHKGVIWAGNHRTFYDLGLLTSALAVRNMKWSKRTSYPVRSDFFYDHILGILVNYLFSAGMMYPPIFRDSNKSAWNKDTIRRIVSFLSLPGSDLGFHPEGSRGKSLDPYELQSAKPGIGQIIFEAKPIVIPFFMNGISNNIWQDFKETRKKHSRRFQPVIIVFGKPIEYDNFITEVPDYQVYKKIADFVLQSIKDLIPREQEIRALCHSEKISHQDSRWLINN